MKLRAPLLASLALVAGCQVSSEAPPMKEPQPVELPAQQGWLSAPVEGSRGEFKDSLRRGYALLSPGVDLGKAVRTSSQIEPLVLSLRERLDSIAPADRDRYLQELFGYERTAARYLLEQVQGILELPETSRHDARTLNLILARVEALEGGFEEEVSGLSKRIRELPQAKSLPLGVDRPHAGSQGNFDACPGCGRG